MPLAHISPGQSVNICNRYQCPVQYGVVKDPFFAPVKTISHTTVASAVAFVLMSAVGCDESSSLPVEPTAFADAPLPGQPDTVTFNKHIAPIVFEHCAPCHRPGEPAPFSLLSYQDVKKRAKQIAKVTQSRFMPPWKPEPGYGEFIGHRNLSADQVDIIQQWVNDGAVEGDPADRRPTPGFTKGWYLGEPDLVLELPKAYPLAAEGTDLFRNFVIPVPVSTTRYVRAVEFRPSNPKIVHHANLRIDPARGSRLLDERDSDPGFDGMLIGQADRIGYLVGYHPGRVPILNPENMTWPLEAGTDLALLVHMLPTGKPEMLQFTLGFHFADQPPTRPSYVLRLASKIIDIPAGKKNYQIKDTYVLPMNVVVLGVRPHAHYLGRDIKGFATLPDGSTQWLIRIKDWDFNWQDEYRFIKPIPLSKGTTLTMAYTYDNSADNVRNPHHPPQRVRWGPKTTDEMGTLLIQVLLRDTDALRTLDRNFMYSEVSRNIASYEKWLQENPNDAQLHNNLGAALRSRGKLEAAIGHFQQALRIKPEFAEAHSNLGVVFASQGKLEEAINHFLQALKLKPDYAEAHSNLGVAFAAQDRLDQAINHFREALRIWPEHAQTHNNLAVAMTTQRPRAFSQGSESQAQLAGGLERRSLDPGHAPGSPNP